MVTILNIETSSKICSVALTKDGATEFEMEDSSEMNHAMSLAPFVERCMEELKRKDERLEAVAVSMGPGSYTGLRIGLSLAKGLCFSLGIPLIGISTLKILAVKAMFRNVVWEGDETILCLIDARRMEVYAGGYDFSLKSVFEEQPVILTSDSFSSFRDHRKVIFIGNGSEKFKPIYSGKNGEWLGNLEPHARDMTALAEKYFREKNFLDLAYATPNYLKNFQATTPKNSILNNNGKKDDTI